MMNPQRILVVDDKENNVYFLRALLEGAGYAVDSATSGAEALEQARRTPPDLLVSDILMPVMDGFTLCREWKKDPRLRAIPLVFYTGTYTDDRDRAFALSLGADDFITKPQEPAPLLERLQGFLGAAARTPAPDVAKEDPGAYLRQYNETLVRKLESKMEQLERDLIARTQAEENLRVSEVRFHELFQNMSTGIAIYEASPDGQQFCFKDVNQALLLGTGLSRPEIIGKRVEDIFPGVAEMGLLDMFRRVWKTGASEMLPARPYVDPRMTRWFDNHVYKLPSGEIVALFDDVTEEMQAKNALVASEARFRSFVENANDIVYSLDSNGVFTYVSPNWTEILGHAPADVLGHPIADFLHPDDLPACLAAIHRAQPGHKIAGIEYRVRRLNGDWRWHMTNGVALPQGPAGKLTFIGISRDIHDHKQNESFRLLADSVLAILNQDLEFPEAIQKILDALQHATGCDAVAMRLKQGEDFPFFASHGFPPDFLESENSLLARDPQGQILRNPDGRPRLVCTCGLVLSALTNALSPFSTPDGSAWTNDASHLVRLSPTDDPRLAPRNRCIHEGYSSLALIPIRAKSEIIGLLQLNSRSPDVFSPPIIDAIEDIAGHLGQALMRKQAEEEKDRLQSQLNQIQKIDSVGRLAGGVAHDFNNMLQVILGYVELAMRQMNPDDPLYDDLLKVRKAAERSSNLTRQLLAFARKQVISPRVIDLNETVEVSISLLRRLLGERIDLVWYPAPDLGPLLIDPSQIDQILTNLCINARDARPNGGKLTIQTGTVSFDPSHCARNPAHLPGQYLLLSVGDEGSGMAPEILAKIFEPFFTTKEVGQGTGLGLSTVYGIVKHNRGFIDVASQPGQGSVFTIYLPCHEGDPTINSTPSSQNLSGPRERETILLVEDEPSILALGDAMLRKLGYKVLSAESPRQAIALAEKTPGPIHLLLTDVVMPEMDGRELAKHILAIHPDIKRIFMSGYTADVIGHKGIMDSGIQFIEKPFTMAILASKIRAVLDA